MTGLERSVVSSTISSATSWRGERRGGSIVGGGGDWHPGLHGVQRAGVEHERPGPAEVGTGTGRARGARLDGGVQPLVDANLGPARVQHRRAHLPGICDRLLEVVERLLVVLLAAPAKVEARHLRVTSGSGRGTQGGRQSRPGRRPPRPLRLCMRRRRPIPAYLTPMRAGAVAEATSTPRSRDHPGCRLGLRTALPSGGTHRHSRFEKLLEYLDAPRLRTKRPDDFALRQPGSG